MDPGFDSPGQPTNKATYRILKRRRVKPVIAHAIPGRRGIGRVVEDLEALGFAERCEGVLRVLP